MSRIHKFQSNQSVMWPRAEETVGNRGKVVTWKRTDRVDAINPVFVKVVLPLGLRQISRHIEVLPGGPRQETLTNQSVSERVSCSLIHSHFKTLIIIFQCRVHFRPIHMQLESPSVLVFESECSKENLFGPWCRKNHCRRVKNISDTSVKL